MLELADHRVLAPVVIDPVEGPIILRREEIAFALSAASRRMSPAYRSGLPPPKGVGGEPASLG